MSGPVVDLHEIRIARDAAVRLGRAMAEAKVAVIAARIASWAERAAVGSEKLMRDDPEAADGVARWCLRRLRGDVRRIAGTTMPDAARTDLVETAEAGFWGRLGDIEAERAGMMEDSR